MKVLDYKRCIQTKSFNSPHMLSLFHLMKIFLLYNDHKSNRWPHTQVQVKTSYFIISFIGTALCHVVRHKYEWKHIWTFVLLINFLHIKSTPIFSSSHLTERFIWTHSAHIIHATAVCTVLNCAATLLWCKDVCRQKKKKVELLKGTSTSACERVCAVFCGPGGVWGVRGRWSGNVRRSIF